MPRQAPKGNVFATHLSLCLKERGMDQIQLADEIGVSGNTVSSWATGAGSPKAARLPGIAQALQVSVGGLFGEKQESEVGTSPKEAGFAEALVLIRLLAGMRLGSAAEAFVDAAPDLLEILRRAERIADQ